MSPETFRDLLDMEAIGSLTCLTLADGSWTIGGVDCLRIARQEGTPVFVLSVDRIRGNCELLLRAFGHGEVRCQICYAVKANCDPAVLSTVSEYGFGAEVASEQELLAAMSAGIRPEKTIFNGNAKTDAQLRLALEKGVQSIVADCREELIRLDELAGTLGRPARCALRVNLGSGGGGGMWNMSDRDSKFGTPLEGALDLYRFIAESLGNLEPVGIHCHPGSQNTGGEIYFSALEKLTDLVAALREHDIRLEFVDIGGGFPVPSLLWSDYSPPPGKGPSLEELTARFDLEDLGRRLTARMAELCAERRLEPLLLIVEPGSSVVKDSGILLTTVQATKPHPDRGRPSWVAADAGCHTLPDCWICNWHFECLPLNTGLYSLPVERRNVAGPLCDSADIIARNRLLPPLRRGEVLAFLQTGGYQSAMQSTFHLLPRAPTVLAAGGRLTRSGRHSPAG